MDDGSMDKKRKVRSFLVALLTSVLTGWFPIVFLYAKENENTKGLIDTGMNLVKNGREISIEKKRCRIKFVNRPLLEERRDEVKQCS